MKNLKCIKMIIKQTTYIVLVLNYYAYQLELICPQIALVGYTASTYVICQQ